MSKRSVSIVHFIVLIMLVIFTIALGVNNYNSGVYADAHGLDGAKIGWFEPFGLPIFVLSALITLCYAVYIKSSHAKD